MKIKKILSLTLISASLISCGAKTEDKNLQSKLILSPFIQKATVKPSELDSLVRSVTLIAYPTEGEIKGFSFEVAQDVFETVFFSEKTIFEKNEEQFVETTTPVVSYGDRMPRGIAKDLSSAKKISHLITQLVNIGDVRDKAYESFVSNEAIASPIREVIIAVDEKVSKNLTFFKINDAGEFKNKLVLSKLDGYKVSKVTTKNCEQLITRRLPDVAEELLTEEQKVHLNTIVEECSSLTTENEQLEIIEESQKNLIFDFGANVIASESIFYNGKTYVTSMLDALRDHSGKTFLSTGVFKESILDGTYPDPGVVSTIEFNESGDNFNVFSLRLDFLGRGLKTYSLENNLIKNLKFSETSLGEKVLHFELDGGDVTVKAKLGMTLMPKMGLRFVGDADFFFKNGVKNRGVMKIEIDSLNDKRLIVK